MKFAVTNIALLMLVGLVPNTESKSDTDIGQDAERKHIVVVPPPRKSLHPSGLHGEESGNDEEEIDQDTISTLSNNVLSTTNIVHAQSQLVEDLGERLKKVRHLLNEEKERLTKESRACKKNLMDVSDKLQNTTNLVNVLVLMWSKTEKNYLQIVKKLGKKIDEGQGLITEINKTWEQRLESLENKLEMLQLGTDNTRRMAVSKRSRWPDGKFCILANGACPPGFFKQRGFLKTVYMYDTSKRHIKSMRMGSSYIGCYGQYCGQYGQYATINIASCCK